MKILHICLCAHLTEKMLYQENVLSERNAIDGHDVTVITDVFHYENGKLVKTQEEDRIMENGVRLIRLEWDRVLFSDKITEKIQKCRKLKKYLEEIGPDSILFHGCNGYELMDVADYCKAHPDCLFFVDDHADFTTTAMTWLSKAFYQIVHGHFVHKALPEIDKVLYLGVQMKDWLKAIYNMPEDKMEFMAIGGIIYTPEQQKKARQDIIDKYSLPQDAIIMAHSGKLSAGKRTADLIEAFRQVDDPRMALFVFGSIPDDMAPSLRSLMESDARIHFMGWKVNKEIEAFLAGTDLYCQPGSQSSTFETAMCCGCANMTFPHKTYKDETYSDCDGHNYFFVETVDDMVDVFKQITDNRLVLEQTKAKSFAFAKMQFDYEVIARRIYKK
ncbi:MAG: glycosyltransferase family 4 protein [Pseudobutyrivibrio sp.]|nr:glycosyltransferase family 4 protein [Pseudobutyrivibrio sp.]